MDSLTATTGEGVGAERPQGMSAWLLVIVSAMACIAIAVFSGTHIGLLFIALPIVVTLVWLTPRTMLVVLPIWMVMLGLVRRLTPGGGNVTFSGDPVLIIGPVIILLLFFIAASRGAFSNRTRFSTIVMAFGVLALLEAFNPAQGSLLAGLGGLLFILVPMLAFWIGRVLLDRFLALQIVRSVAVISLFAAMYGLYQQFVGLPSWDKSWISSKGYAALSVGSGVIRAFGTFSSAEEYAAFLSIGLVAWLALAYKDTRMFPPIHLAGIVTVAIALWYESERTAVFLTVLAIGVMAASRLRMRPIGVLAGGIGAVLLLIFLGGHLGSGGGGTSGVLSTHVLSGIKGPLSAGSSLPGHIRATRFGMLQAFKNPLGHGTGSVTLAANRYAHSRTVGTEFDPGNMGIAFGILGLIVYAAFAWQAIKTAYKSAVLFRDAVSLFVIGMLMATLFQWTNGDLYSVCWLIWLFLGYLDVTLARATAEAVERAPAAPPAWTWRRPGEPRRRPPAPA